jgi:cell division protein FtsZ
MIVPFPTVLIYLSAEEISTNERLANPILRVSVVGVGGAGNNLLSHAIGGGVSPSRCVAVNTDRGQLSRSLARNKIFLDQNVSSTAAKVVTRRDDQRTFQSAAHRVTSYTDGSDFTIVVTGLGGGTGTESAPIIAQRSRTPVRPVVSVVAIPFIHERERRFIALRGLKRMVEACDCTIVIDNGIDRDYLSTATRSTDETASIAVRSLTELLSGAEDVEARDILEVLSKGDLATVCNFTLRTGDTLQSSVIQALRTPSANLPLKKAKGALLLYRGPATLSTAQFAQAYDALVSMVGSDLSFIHGSIYTQSDPSVCLFLTGYTYGTALNGFIDFVELYDAEYGQEEGDEFTTLSVPLYQMEQGQNQRD